MKSNLVWIGALLLGVAACSEEKEEEAVKEKVPSRPAPAQASRTTSLKPTRPAPPSSEAPAPMIKSTPGSAITPLSDEELAAQKLEREAQQAERDAQRAEQRAQRVVKMTEQITAQFKERDADGDGLLTKEEVSERMQSRFGDADTNSDGYLDANEQEAIVQEIAKRMSEFDRNARGRGFGGGAGNSGRGRNFGGGRPSGGGGRPGGGN